MKSNQSTTKSSSSSSSSIAWSQCQEARQVWLKAKTTEELDQVENLYRQALNAKQQQQQQQNNNKTNKQHGRKRQKISSSTERMAQLTRRQYRQAGERLGLLYCQSGRTSKAKPGLHYLGFVCRLAQHVLDYPSPKLSNKHHHNNNHNKNKKTKKSKISTNGNSSSPPCVIYDNFLQPHELKYLQSVFQDPKASYWGDHDYHVEPPSPYFSYVIPLKDCCSGNNSNKKKKKSYYGSLGRLIHKVWSMPELQKKYPNLRSAQYVEMWAHNRPHASGHQLHFDSDDEGRGGVVKNPIISTILYIPTTTRATQNDDEDDDDDDYCAGGPSLVTNQRLTSEHLATKGWLAHPKAKRLVAFDGSVLHGVIPGKGVPAPGQTRRVTLMLAFWKDIQIRDDPHPGSARPFPLVDPPQWAANLTRSFPDNHSSKSDAVPQHAEQDPITLDCVYETLDGEPWKVKFGMPDYEQVFQGF